MKNQEIEIKKVLGLEIKNIIYVVGITTSFIFFVYAPINDIQKNQALQQQRLDVIEGNHLTHLQASATATEQRLDKIEQVLSRIEALLK